MNAEASVGLEFGANWQSCSEWITPPDSYVLYANVLMDSPYPNISSVISACSYSRLAAKDGYGNNIFPYNPATYTFPDWVSWDDQSYLARPLPSHVGNYTFTLGVIGRCGIKNVTVSLRVAAEQQFSAQSFTIDACSYSKLIVNNTDGKAAVPFPSGA